MYFYFFGVYMKTFLIALTICLTVTTAFSQGLDNKDSDPVTLETFSVIDNMIVYSATAETERTSYTYDMYGNIASRLDQTWLGNDWVVTGRMSATYAVNGKQLTFLYERRVNDSWENANRGTYTYDANWNLLKTFYEVWDKTTWKDYYHYDYTYDANGNRLSVWYEIWENEQLFDTYRINYTYDSQNNLLSNLVDLCIQVPEILHYSPLALRL